MTTTLQELLPPTATDVFVHESFDPNDPFFVIAGVADAELVDVLVNDFLGIDEDDDEFEPFSLSDHVLRHDRPEPPVEWDDYTTDDYRCFVGL
jgi:hypothetical protein